MKSFNILCITKWGDGRIDSSWFVNEETSDFVFKSPSNKEVMREYIRVMREVVGVDMTSGDNCMDDSKWNDSTEVYEDFVSPDDLDIVLEVFYPCEAGFVKNFDSDNAEGTPLEPKIRKIKAIYQQWNGKGQRPIGKVKKYKGYPIYECTKMGNSHIFKKKVVGYISKEANIPLTSSNGPNHPFFEPQADLYRKEINAYFKQIRVEKVYNGKDQDTKLEDYCYLYLNKDESRKYPNSVPNWIVGRELVEEPEIKKEIHFDGIDKGTKALMNSVLKMNGNDGTCPKCSMELKQIKMALVCPAHGFVGGC